MFQHFTWLSIGWFTLLFVAVIFSSLIAGARRGFASELGELALQIGYLVSAIVAVWFSWRWMNVIANRVAGWTPARWPNWLNHVVTLWQSAPQVARVIAFIILYGLLSGVLHAVVRPIARVLVRVIPRMLAQNKLVGAILGGLAGVIRCIFIGAVVFGLLQFFALPAVRKWVTPSRPYQYLVTHVYRPYLAPVLEKELPVLGKDAMGTLSQNISLFVLPSGTAKAQRGIVLVPKQIAALAKQITAGDKTDRERAKALYEWESHHISYDWVKYQDYVKRGQWDAQTPLQTLQTRKGVCADYALLYAELAHAVGLKVQVDEGIGGTPSDSGSHAWNQVWDSSSQRWIAVDTTWGSTQDRWFDAPDFSATHHEQRAIIIDGGRH